jgi:uncharacterized protein (TIGR03067 family)
MRMIAVLAALPMLLSGSLATLRAEDKGDQDNIQGSWTVSYGEKAGSKAPADVLKDGRMTFTGGDFAWKMADKESRGTFTLEPNKSPAAISLSLGGMTLAGIYKFKGDELTICVGSGNDRPTDFATKSGEKSLLLVLTREKP